MFTRTGIRIALLGTLAVMMLAVGCRQKLTFERWEALRVGQSRSAVRSALGKPLDERGLRLTYARHDDGIAAEVWLDAKTGGLVYTRWTDPTRGIREKGLHPGP